VGFKLRTPGGKLLWKVKIADAKIKISADEQGAHPWVISLKHGDKLEVTDAAGHDAGLVRADAKGSVRVADAAGHLRFTAKVGWPSAVFGVLLIDGIPPQEAWILMAEILALGY